MKKVNYNLNAKEIRQLFFNNIERLENGCWEWKGNGTREGYGWITLNGKQIRAHRLSASLFLSFDLDSELLICHHCDNPPCVNPDHLFIGTQADNIKDMIQKGRSNYYTLLGESQTEEHKRRIGMAQIGEKNHMYGKKHNKETKRKMSEKNKGRVFSNETRRKMSENMKIVWIDRRKEGKTSRLGR